MKRIQITRIPRELFADVFKNLADFEGFPEDGQVVATGYDEQIDSIWMQVESKLFAETTEGQLLPSFALVIKRRLPQSEVGSNRQEQGGRLNSAQRIP